MSTTASMIYNICLLAVWTAFLWKNLTPRFSFRVTMLICAVVVQMCIRDSAIVDFQPYMGKVRKPGTGCISQINDHLFEGRYSPTWIDGKKHARNVYAHTREECEEKLKVLIAEMKTELAELKRQKAEGV